VSCGTCPSGKHCNANHCDDPTENELPTVPGPGGAPTPIADLPDSPTSPVGATPGTFSVSESGTPQYTIPIEVPPGRAGVEPALSLQYGASPESGELGLGWRLEGLSKVTRCPRINALDGHAEPVAKDNDDRLCLDGARLIAHAVPDAETTEYTTIVDNFARILAHVDPSGGIQPAPEPGVTIVERDQQGPDSFEVFTNDGRILSYGRSGNSLVMAPSGVRLAWLLDGIRDRAGNTVIVKYEKLGAILKVVRGNDLPTAVRPKSIFYTGHGDTPGNREVRFTYESRGDSAIHYHAGGLVSITEGRLRRITTFVDGVAVKNYRLGYKAEQDLSQLDHVSECTGDADETCKPPTTFQYEAEPQFTRQNPYDLAGGVQLDADGNGIPDYLVTRATFDGVPSDPTLQAVSIATDIGVAVATSFASAGVGIGLSIAWTLMEPTFWGLFQEQPEVHVTSAMMFGTGERLDPNHGASVSGFPCGFGFPTFVFDFDRDGRDDIGAICGHAGAELRVALSGGDGRFHGFPSDQVKLIDIPLAGGMYQSGVSTPPVMYDADGDGLEDILYCTSDQSVQLRLRANPGQEAEFRAPIQYFSSDTLAFCRDAHPTFNIFDIDGDGVADLLVADPWTSEWNVLRIGLRESGGLHLHWDPVAFENFGQSAYGEGLALGDMNGDGLLDIAADRPAIPGIFNTPGTPASTMAWLNTGNNKFLSKTLVPPAPVFDPIEWDSIPTLRGSLLLDYNGDGLTDFLQHWQNAVESSAARNSFNWALLSNGYYSSLTPREATDLAPPNEHGNAIHARIALAADVDADGNTDLLGPTGTFYGGSTRRLLTRVVDGAGAVVTIGYDGPQTYRNDCVGPTWPVACAKRMNSLVAGRGEGFMGDDGNPVIERVTTYKYRNARVNVAGHGWLNFDERQESESSTDGIPYRTTTIRYQPPEPYSLASQSSEPKQPYVYPLAGLPQSIIIDQFFNTNGPMPLESGRFARRTRTENVWTVDNSFRERPFPRLDTRTTTVFERPIPPPPQSLSFEDDGIPLTSTEEIFETDSLGRVRFHYERFVPADGPTGLEAYELTTTHTIWQSDTGPNWLIGNIIESTVTSQRGPDGAFLDGRRHWQYEYDGGLLKRVTRGDLENQQVITDYLRDEFGNPYHVVQTAPGEQARTTSITYDADHIYPTFVINALGHATQSSFDERWGKPKTIVDPNYVVTQHSYDGFGLVGQTVDPTGTSLYDYSNIAPGAAAEETAAGPVHPRIQLKVERQGTAGTHAGKVVTQVDSYGRTVRTLTDGFGGTEVVEEQSFDQRGRVVGATRPHSSTQSGAAAMLYSYDGLDRVIGVDQGPGAHAEMRYATRVTLKPEYAQWLDGIDCDGASDQACVVDIRQTIDEEGKTGVAVFDHRGLVLRSIDGNNVATTQRVSEYVYGAHNQLRRARDNGGNTTEFNHDAYGRLINFHRPGLAGPSYQYNGYDELKLAQLQGLPARTYFHDPLGRLTTIVDGDNETTWTYDLGENALGRISSMTSPASTENPEGIRVGYTYEPVAAVNRGLLKRIDCTIDGVDYAVGADHDDLGRIRRVDYPDVGGAPVVVQYGYDAASGSLSSVDEVGSGTTKSIWRLTEAFQGHMIKKETFGNGASTTYGYDAQRYWLDSIGTTLHSSSIQNLGYTHYANGSVFERTRGSGAQATTEEFSYDNLNRLSAINGDLAYGYDDLDNITQRGASTISYEPTRPHFIATVDGNAYDYDARGNVSYRGGPGIPGGSQTFAYTPFDLPSTITTGAGSEGKVTSFEYSADEQRLVRRDADTVRHFVGDLYERLATTAGSTQEQRFHVFAGARPIAEIVRRAGVDETLYLHADDLGTVDTISSGSTDTTTNQAFDAFGSPAGAAPELTRSGFTGHAHDRDLGLIDMRGRVYDPLGARFMSPDPVMQAPFSSQGLNAYTYVFNDPINYTDPSGLISWGDVAGAAVIAGHVAGAALIANGFVTAATKSAAAGLKTTQVAIAAANAGRGIQRAMQGGAQGVSGPQADPKDTSAWLAQNAGDPNTGATGGPGTGSSEPPHVDDSQVLGDMATVAPLPGPGKVRLGVTIWQWIKRLAGVGRAARVGAEALQVGRFKLTETVGKHLADVVKHGAHKGELARPYLRSPHTIEGIMKAGKGVPDPGGAPGALRWDVPGTFRGSQGTWELVVDKSNSILHMNFR